MKVGVSYYLSNFRCPEGCQAVATATAAAVAASGRPYNNKALLLKRLQSWVNKYYKLTYLGPEVEIEGAWLENPGEFLVFCHAIMVDLKITNASELRLSRADKRLGFTANNLIGSVALKCIEEKD